MEFEQFLGEFLVALGDPITLDSVSYISHDINCETLKNFYITFDTRYRRRKDKGCVTVESVYVGVTVWGNKDNIVRINQAVSLIRSNLRNMTGIHKSENPSCCYNLLLKNLCVNEEFNTKKTRTECGSIISRRTEFLLDIL